MLKGIDPLLSPDLLRVLAEMGHGDEIALVDCHFPAVTNAKRLIRMDGIDLPSTARAILSLLPIDTFIEQPVGGMMMVDTPERLPEVQAEVFADVNRIEGREVGVERIERFAFYERAHQAFAIVATGEQRPYGNVILTKGVLADFD